MQKSSWYGDPGASTGMTKDKHTYMQREILKQVQDDIGGAYHYPLTGSTLAGASGMAEQVRHDEEEHTYMRQKAVTVDADSASGDPETSSG